MLKSALYLHIPFCDSKCGYCAFNSKTNKNHLKQPYMQTLANYLTKKLQILQESYNKIQITSIYIGGGTPSVVESYLYENIFAAFKPYLCDGCEITIEANPNSLDLEWLRNLKSYGVNRLSLGVQSFFEKKLEFLEREHKIKNSFNALEMAQSVGLDNVSIDLIYGTPFCIKNVLQEELEISKKLPIAHISAYELSLDAGSRFYKTHRGILKDSSDEFCGFASMGHFVKAYLEGFLQYEVSNYGRVSLHNLNYWQGGNYLGIGAGAFGCVENERYFMPRNIYEFMQDFKEIKESLNKDDLELERLFLGFRSCVGVDIGYIKNRQKLEILLQENKVFMDNDRIFAKDYFLGDEIALYLL
ncbi:MAG: radical SAM family heme chaperone HemW [Helicobacter sp.]|nr:radical SAM family heme chaperone HemW [Helicobacteraceae bacterium]MDY3113167.1 radical SAM family heme chaperone HemW [Helicobacter sp.]